MAGNFNDQVVFRSTSALAADDDFTMLRVGQVFDAFAWANGAAGGNVTVKNTAVAITDAMNINGGDKAIGRAGTISASNSFAVGSVLRITKSAAISSDTIVYLTSTGYQA
jgi:hypothetical protein